MQLHRPPATIASVLQIVDSIASYSKDLRSSRKRSTCLSSVSRWFSFAAVILMVGVLATQRLSAQIETGGVTGTVKDSSSASVAGAQIALINNATGVVRTARSTGTGTYVFQSVPTGAFTLRVVSAGFETAVVANVDVHLQRVITQDITLQVGATKQEVTITAAAPLLDSESGAVGTEIDSEQIVDLPLNGRDWAALAQLSAGVTTASTQFSGAPGSAYFSIDGASVWQTDFRLDGIDDNVEIYGGPGATNSNVNVTPPPDAIQEFKMQNGNFNAEFGHSVGGIINAVIRSGTNSIHGDLWEFVRNDKFDANDYFSNQNGTKKAEHRQNQFGGTIGGPVWIPKLYDGRNKTFFFFDYQGTRVVQPSPSTSTVPTALMQSSGFTNLQDIIANNSNTKTDALGRIFPYGTILDPATTRAVAANSIDPVSGLVNTTGNSIYVRDPFFTGGSVSGIRDFTGSPSQLNQIPASRLDPNAVKLLNLYPAPTNGGLNNNYFQNGKTTQTSNQLDARFDETLGTHDTMFGVFDWSHFTVFQPNSLPGIANGAQYGSGYTNIPVYAIALGETHIFTPTLTNEAHLGWTHNIEQILPTDSTTMGIPAQFGIQGVPQITDNGGLPIFNIGGLSTLGTSCCMPTLSTITTLEFMDNVFKVYRNHNFKAGVQFDRFYGGLIQSLFGKGQFAINGQYSDIPNLNTSTNGIADLILTPAATTVPNGIDNVGGLSSFQGTNTAPTRDLRHYLATYFQDDWKVTPTLTLNLGLRWDYFQPYEEINGRQANFIQSDGGNGSSGTYYIPTKGCAVPRAASFDTLLAASNISLQCTSNLATGNAQNKNFAPRLGFAKRITPVFVIRGGYGITYGALANIGFGPTLGNNYPFVFALAYNSTDSQHPLINPAGTVTTMENALSSINIQDATLANPAGLTLNGRQYNFQTPYSQTYNLFMQYQFTKSDAVQIGYVGVAGRHLDSLGTHNSASIMLPPGTNIYNYIPFPSFAPNSNYETTNGTSSYNSMQLTYQHQLNHGLNLLANYTYSKCMTDEAFYASADQSYRAQWLAGFGVKGDYSLCDTDATHVVHVAGEYQLPVGRGQTYLAHVNRVVDAVLGGWAANYIYTFQGGQPFPVGCPTATTANFGCYAFEVPGQGLYSGAHTQKEWLNPKAFAAPPAATAVGQTDYSPLGGAPMIARGPHLNNLDFSVFKQFQIEKIRLEFRAEFFNLTNTPQFGMPGNVAGYTSTGPGNPNQFSTITSLRNNPRLGQLALKLYY